MSSDGRYLATASEDKAVIWNLATGKQVARMIHESEVLNVAFSRCGQYAATVSSAGTALVWDLTGNEPVKVTRLIHDGPVRHALFSQDGCYLATASEDKMARVWDLASGKEVSRIIHPQGVMEVAFNGRRLATACRDGKVRVWLWHPEDLIAEACSRLTRNLTLEEWHQYLGDDIAYERTCLNLPEPEA